VVTTTADSGPGSLRQGGPRFQQRFGATNTIDFAIPGAGIQTIAPVTPLPPITSSVLIDGTSQPGYAGTPLIDLTGQELGGFRPAVDRRVGQPARRWRSMASPSAGA